MNLPPRQTVILHYFADAEDAGRQASRAEAATDLGYAFPSAVSKHIDALVRKGLVQADREKKRNVRLTDAGWAAMGRVPSQRGVPILGAIAAGSPILAHEHAIGHLDKLTSMPGHFALRIQGQSMIDAGILDGDYAIIELEAPVRDGQIAAVLLQDEATLKRVRYLIGNRVLLEPANAAYNPIEVDAEMAAGGFTIIGPLRIVYRAVH